MRKEPRADVALQISGISTCRVVIIIVPEGFLDYAPEGFVTRHRYPVAGYLQTRSFPDPTKNDGIYARGSCGALDAIRSYFR